MFLILSVVYAKIIVYSTISGCTLGHLGRNGEIKWISSIVTGMISL